jgi:hypothetical protein
MSQICDYGCGRLATTFKPYSKRWCCETSQNKCPAIKTKQNTQQAIEARKQGVRSKYGVDNISQIQAVKDKKIATCLSNYGVENPNQSSIIRQKAEATNLDRYGGTNPRHCDKVKEKGRQTCLERYGVDNGSKTEQAKTKISSHKLGLTDQEKLQIAKRREETCLERYGVRNVSQNEKIHYSKLVTARAKTYTFPSGQIATVQGYEPQVLDSLLKAGIREQDIKVGRRNVPTIRYHYEGKDRFYFPDIYIASHNWIIEVKSLFTFRLEREKNMAKRVATKADGYSFSFVIR